MDPFAKKMWSAGLAYAALLAAMAAVLTVAYIHERPRCGDRIVTESSSPDRRWIAAVIERRCGEESPFITQINLRPGDTKLMRGFFSGQASQDNVFTIEQDAAGAGFTLQWNGADQLIVHCRHCDRNYVRRQDPQQGTLMIRYDLR
jgi:hypothetical protein